MARDFASTIDVYPDYDALDITSNMTVACWTYPDTLGLAGRWLVLRDQHFAFNNGSDGIHSFVWWDGTNARRMRPSSIGTGAWKHVCFQVQSNDCYKFWLNGVDSSVSVSSWFAASRVLTNQMDIGGRTSVGEYWDGRICEFSIWDAVLDSSEIGALYDGYSASLIRPTSLKFYAPMVRDNVNLRGPAATTIASSVAAHPRIIRPHRRMARRFTTASAPAGLAANPMRGGGAAANPIWGYV